MQSVTFSTTSVVKGTRIVDVVADDTNDTGDAPGNAGVDSVVVAIAAPVMRTTSGFQTLLSFDGTSGYEPYGSLTVSADGSTLYGMTEFGGANNEGTIFSIPALGGTPTILLSFNGTDGEHPVGGLTLSGSTLYGTTPNGGANGDGNIFSIPVTGGTPTTLLSFNGTNGELPQGNLTLSGSTLYGMTEYGGASGDGNIFSIPVTGGTPTNLFSFNDTNGAFPQGGLTLSGSTLYGMTTRGGANNEGTIFSIPVTGGTPTTLGSFNGTNANEPVGGLTLSGSTLYGMSEYGGAYEVGNIFSIPVTGGTPATLLSFSGENGDVPTGSLTLSGSTLYGMTWGGGAHEEGNVFSVPVTGGTPTTRLSFNGLNGEEPYGDLTLSGSTLYGMTEFGGAYRDGTVFSLNTAGIAGQTFTLGGSAVTVDSGATVTSYDTDITGASMAITNDQSGDSLIYTPINGITIASNSGGVLNLTGSATPAQYTAALQSVTFSTTSINQTTRTIDVVADDSAASPTTSYTGVDTVNVAIAPPLVTANQASVDATAGQTVSVDSAVTVSSFDTDVTGVTMTIGTGYQSGSDTLSFINQNGISGSYAAGVLTLSGSATPAQYQAALQSVTFSSISTSTATRNISIVVNDSGDTGNVSSNTATTQIVVSAPVTITAAYVSGSAWTTPTFSNTTERFDTYLVNNGLGDPTIPTVGYALQTGANQLIPLPWANVNTISVTFSGAVSDIGLGSLELVGGTGTGSVAAPAVTGFTSDGSNTYSWTLASSLGNNKYVLAIATTGSSFGTAGSTQVVDANGAGISGTFTTGQAFPSGNGFAGSTFDFFFDLLPGDGNRATTSTSSADTALAKSVNNQHETSATYNPYVDYDGAGIDSATDVAFNGSHNNVHNSTLTSPTAPSDSSGVGITALALGVQETGSSLSASSQPGSSPAATVSNVVSASPSSSAGKTSTSTGSTGTGGTGSSTTTTSTSSRDHAHHQFAASERFAAADEALSDINLADLYV